MTSSPNNVPSGEELEESVTDRENELKKRRILFYKTALNIFRGRCLSLKAAGGVGNSDVVLGEDATDNSLLSKSVDAVQTSVTQLLALKKCLETIHSNLTCYELSYADNSDFKREIIQVVKQIVYFTKSVMHLHQSCDQLQFLQMKKNYAVNAQVEFYKSLQDKRSNTLEIRLDEAQSKRIARAEMLVEKINITRTMKAILIASFGADHKTLEEIQHLRSPYRKNLTLDDFVSTWQHGL